MAKRKIIYLIIFILLVVSSVLWGIIFHSQSQELRIIFFDIGQGDAALIIQGQNQILIDGGPDSKKELEKIGQYVPFWDRKIEIIIATHPDQDHIDGLTGVMENYEVGKIIESPAESESQVYKNYLDVIGKKNIERVSGERGLNIKLASANIEILHPDPLREGDLKDTNSQSIVANLTYGQNTFLFTGDLPSDQETELIENKMDLSARVLKVAHHGSKYSTSAEFISKVNPAEAVISVGKNNRYGHPAQEVLNRLKEKNIKILRTDEKGDIIYECKDLQSICALELR